MKPGHASGRRAEKTSAKQKSKNTVFRAFLVAACHDLLRFVRGVWNISGTFFHYEFRPQWLAEYCETSVAMIEKHYGRYINSDSREQLKRLFGAKTETFSETLRDGTDDEIDEVVENLGGNEWSGRVDLNHRLHGPEPCALPS